MTRGREADAIPVAEDSVQIARDLVEAEPSAYALHLALSLMNCADHHYRILDIARAKALSLEAVNLYDEYADPGNPVDWVQHADCMVNYASLEIVDGNPSSALPFLERAITIYAAVCKDEPAMWRSEAGNAHLTLSEALYQIGQYAESLSQVDLSITLLSQAVDAGGVVWGANLTFAWLHKGVLLLELEGYQAAMSARVKGAELKAKYQSMIERRGTLFVQRVENSLAALLNK